MLSILGVGQAHPQTIIDNAFLESLDIGTSDEWIMERVGIKTRHSVLPLDYIRQTRNSDPRAAYEVAQTTASNLGAQAAGMALSKAGIQASDIGLLIAGISVPQMQIPAHACLIAAQLGIRVPAFDLNSACSTSAAQLHFLNGMDPKQLPDYILVVQAETYTMTLDFNDRNSSVLFGDGAAAFVLSAKHPGKAQIIASSFDSDPMNFDKVVIPAHGHFSQQGSAVQRFAITQTVSTYEKLIAQCQIPTVSYFIGHQANLRMLESSCERIHIASENHLYNVNKYGNCGGCGGPTVLAEHWDNFKNQDYVALVTVGSGLSWGGVILRFGDTV